MTDTPTQDPESADIHVVLDAVIRPHEAGVLSIEDLTTILPAALGDAGEILSGSYWVGPADHPVGAIPFNTAPDADDAKQQAIARNEMEAERAAEAARLEPEG